MSGNNGKYSEHNPSLWPTEGFINLHGSIQINTFEKDSSGIALMPLLGKMRHYKVLVDLVENVANKIEEIRTPFT
jgi:hypothetical protein